MKNYHIMTFGCQMNENDSEKIAGIVENLGFEKTHDAESAELIIINTCSVRENANNRFFGNLGRLKKLKEKKKELIIAVCGCMMQEEHMVNAVTNKYKFVDIVFGTHNIGSLPQLLEQAEDNNMAIEILPDAGIEEDLPIKREFSHKAFVSIMNGCDNFCSYCIVPFTRGREKSRNSEVIIKEIEKLAKDGVKEITLLGQNVNSYGKGLSENNISFAQLLRQASTVEGIKRVRFMTSHPKDLSDELIEVIKDNSKVCSHIHLPMQSGSSKVLKEMNRKYDKKTYLNLVEKIRKEIPGIAITTDIIVGFPGETEEDFLDTLDVYEKCRFDSAFTYIYSQREGTSAAKMEYSITNEEIKSRFDRLLALHNKIMKEHNDKLVGTIAEVLVEGVSKKRSEYMTGRTDTFKLVNFKAINNKNIKAGDIVSVLVEEVNTFNLTGREIEN